MAWKPLLVLCFLVVLLGGCRKDRDETGPVITWLAPAEGTTLTIPDTLAVHVHVSDPQQVRRVTFSLTDANGIPIAPAVVVDVNNTGATIQRGLVVNSEAIPTGSYTLNIRAQDANDNHSSAYRQVHVLGTPLRLRSIFITPPEGGSIMRIDSSGMQSTFLTLDQVGVAAVNSLSQQLYVAGGPHAPMQVYPMREDIQGWQIPNQNSQGGPYFTNARTDPADQRTYVSSNDGLIRGHLNGTTSHFTAQALEGHRPYASVVAGHRVISEQRLLGVGPDKLVSYAHNSGALLEHFDLDLVVVDMFAHSDQQILIFGNRNGEGVIQLRNIQEGGVYEMRVFNEGVIRSVTRLPGNSYAIALPQQVIRFTYSSNTATTLYGAGAADLVYDAANESLLAGIGQQIMVIDPTTGSLVNTIQVPMQIGRILPLLNR